MKRNSVEEKTENGEPTKKDVHCKAHTEPSFSLLHKCSASAVHPLISILYRRTALVLSNLKHTTHEYSVSGIHSPVYCNWMNDPPVGKGQYEPTRIEHIANSITHACFILPSIFAGVAMVQEACNPSESYNAILFGFALVTLFSISTTFHMLCLCGHSGNVRFYFHLTDRAVIYLFIAASYTPWLTLIPVGFFGYHLRWFMWLGSLGGIIYNYVFYEKYKKLEMVLYLTLAVAPSLAVLEVPEMKGSYELALGGLVYLLGVVFFKGDGIVPFAHAIWHLFVVAGAFIHQYAIQEYLIGPWLYTELGEMLPNATCDKKF